MVGYPVPDLVGGVGDMSGEGVSEEPLVLGKNFGFEVIQNLEFAVCLFLVHFAFGYFVGPVSITIPDFP